MKKKFVLILTVLAVMLGGVAAFAMAGSMQDPLVSLDYLNGTVKPSMSSEFGKKANAAYAESYQAAQARLDAEAEKVRTQLGGSTNVSSGNNLDQFTLQKRSYGDTISLHTGSGFLFLEGTALATAQNGELINVTQGMASSSMSLEAGNRYLVGEGANVTVNVQSEAALIAPVGQVQTTASGQAALPFTDLIRDAWYYSAISFAYEKKLFNGVSETQFAPSGSVTRGMLATVLYRLAGEPAPSGQSIRFSDVASGAWYEKGILWSASVGIVNGMGDGSFAPDSNVTREQLASMLYRYAESYAKLNTESTGDLDRFSDQGSISGWAVKGLSWAVGESILNGDPSGALYPGYSASRAETATMIQRFSKLVP